MAGNTMHKVVRTMRRSLDKEVLSPRRLDFYKIMMWLVGIVLLWGIVIAITYYLVYLR